jgi:hypothetical protein
MIRCVIYREVGSNGGTWYVVYRYNFWHKLCRHFGYVCLGFSRSDAIETAKKILNNKTELVEIVNI